MNIDERVKVGVLIKYYGNLLTKKQRDIIDMYVDNNLSLAEVSEELNISRQAVKDTLDKSIQSLTKAEEKLKFISRDKKIKNIIENLSIDTVTKLSVLSVLEEE